MDAKEVVESTQVSTDSQTEDTSHLLFEISQDTYETLQDLVARAEERGLNTDATFWLENMFNKHAKVQCDLWDRADDATTLKQAQKGNSKSIKALLGSLGARDEDLVNKLIAQIRSKK